MRVVQVGDVAGVAGALTGALEGLAEVVEVPLAQRAARRSGILKLLVAPMRVVDAWTTARAVERLRPDVVHIHWVPNGIVGLFLDRPWILHCHGRDVSGLSRLRRAPYHWLIRRATGVLFSTPDLEPWVRRIRRDAVYLPTPVPPLASTAERDRDVFLASQAHRRKGSEVAFEAARQLARRLPGLRISASDGPHFEAGAERLPWVPKQEFVARLARSRVVLGQFRLRALGISDLEAMGTARPLVTGVDPGLYDPPPPVRAARTPEEVAAAAEALLRDEAAADELGRSGRAWVRAHHDPRQIAGQLLAIYAAAVSSARPTPHV